MMKKTLGIAGALGILLISGSVAYYLLVVSPKMAQDRLNFEKEQQIAAEKNKKAVLKQQCLERKSKATIENSKQSTPNASLYDSANEDCGE